MRPIALLDEIEERPGPAPVALGQRHHQPQVRLEQVVPRASRRRRRSGAGRGPSDGRAPGPCRRRPCRRGEDAGLDPLGQVDLLRGVQQRDPADLAHRPARDRRLASSPARPVRRVTFGRSGPTRSRDVHVGRHRAKMDVEPGHNSVGHRCLLVVVRRRSAEALHRRHYVLDLAVPESAPSRPAPAPHAPGARRHPFSSGAAARASTGPGGAGDRRARRAGAGCARAAGPRCRRRPPRPRPYAASGRANVTCWWWALISSRNESSTTRSPTSSRSGMPSPLRKTARLCA